MGRRRQTTCSIRDRCGGQLARGGQSPARRFRWAREPRLAADSGQTSMPRLAVGTSCSSATNSGPPWLQPCASRLQLLSVIKRQGGKVSGAHLPADDPAIPPPPTGQHHPGAANLPQKCSRAGSSQASSSWLINGETTTIVTGPPPATGYAIITPSLAQAERTSGSSERRRYRVRGGTPQKSRSRSPNGPCCSHG